MCPSLTTTESNPMSKIQDKAWKQLQFVDERGEDLTPEELAFVASLIDSDRRGTLTETERKMIRGLIRLRAGGWEAYNQSLAVEYRGTTE